MVGPRVFVFLAVTLCFVFCFCAQATVSKEEAIKAINDAKRSTVKALKDAKYELKEAEYVKRDMEWYEEKAELRVSEADAAAAAAVAEAAAALKAAKNNNQDKAVQEARTKRNAAQSLATSEKYKLQNAREAYPNVKNDTATAIQSLRNVLLKAGELDEQAEIEVLPDTSSQDDYTAVRETALGITTQAKALETEIAKAKTLLSGAKAIIYRMPDPTTEELIEKYKADAIVAGAVFQTIVGEAESIVQNIEFNKNQVSMSVETIKKILAITSQTISPRINGFLTTAQDDLKTISQTVNDAHKAQQKIMQRKQHAEVSKAELNGTNELSTAKKGLRFIKFYAEDAESELEKIKEALKSSRKSVRSAHNQRQSASEEHFENDSTLDGEVNAATERPEIILEATEIIPTKEAAEQQTNQKKEEPKREATKISTSQKAERQTDHNIEEEVEETTVKPTNKKAVQLTDQNQQETAEEETTTSASKALEVHTKSRPGESAEEKKTKPTNKIAEVQTNNKPDQFTEEQIITTTSNAPERQTEKKTEQSAEGDTEFSQTNATVEPTMITSAKKIMETSHNTAHQEADKRVLEKKDQTKDKKSEVPTLDPLRKGKTNIPKVPFFGEKTPAPGAWSDRSMIVSVPLLAALIASAVLH